jgi:arginyl-tRNA synthetase
VEFVSANPTGPLHIGNARGAPVGDAIASLLQATGWEVTREYYMNDVGGQIDKLGQSIQYWIRHEGDEKAEGPEGYQGDYVKELARAAQERLGKKIPADEAEAVRVLGRFGIDYLSEEIKRTATTSASVSIPGSTKRPSWRRRPSRF